MNTQSKRSGFTLIELLVVISIIALLAGLAFPALQGAMTAAQKAQASTMCNQLAIAVNLYNTEYGVNPVPSSSSSDYTVATQSNWDDMVKCLNGNKTITGTTATSSIANSRYIQFMSFNKKDLYDTSGTGSQAIYSPVKKAGGSSSTDRWYHMVIDGNYDGTITIEDLSKTSGTSQLSINVGVWAYGDNTTDNTKKVGSYR